MHGCWLTWPKNQPIGGFSGTVYVSLDHFYTPTAAPEGQTADEARDQHIVFFPVSTAFPTNY
jgi:hypothetical protein